MALAAASLLFAIFVSNVVMGAFFRAAFMGDVSEMLVLLAASIFFVVAILRSERLARDQKNQ